MDSDDAFWLGLSTVIITGFVLVIIVTTKYYTNKNQTIADLIAGGADPISVSCAIDDEYGKHPTCIIKALERS